MEGVPIEPHSLAYIPEVAAAANEYINGARSKKEVKSRSKEAIEQLNGAIQDAYLHQEVTVFGIHQKAAFAPKDSTYHIYLKEGSVTGLSDGFVIVDAESDFEAIEAHNSARQNALLNRVREMSYGRYITSHLLTLEQRRFVRNDFLMQTDIRARAFAPAAISEIFLEGATYIPEDSRTLEAERIVTASDPLTAKLVESLLAKVEESDETMYSLINGARTFRKIHTMNPVASKATMHLLENSLAEDFFGQVYHFAESVPIIEEQGEKIEFSKLIGPDIRMLITSLASGPHADIKSQRFVNETALYLGACRMAGNVVLTNPVYIPLEHLEPSKIESLGRLNAG